MGTGIQIRTRVDYSRASSCCGQPVLLEDRLLSSWGQVDSLGVVERCSRCRRQL